MATSPLDNKVRKNTIINEKEKKSGDITKTAKKPMTTSEKASDPRPHKDSKLPVIIGYGPQPSVDDANKWIDETIRIAKQLNQSNQELRRCVFFLVWYDIHKLVWMSRALMFKDIIRRSGLNRSTIYDYANAALVETELKLTQGVMAVDALVYLKEHASKDEWRDIFNNGMESKRVDQEIQKSKKKKRSRFPRKVPNEYLSKKQIQDSIKNHNRHSKRSQVDNGSKTEGSENSRSNVININSLKSSKKRTSKLDGWDSEFGNLIIDPLQSAEIEYDEDDQNRQMTAEKALKRIENYSLKELEILSKRIFPTSKVGKDTYQILHEMTDYELKKFKAELRALCNDGAYELTDEQVAYYDAEFHALYEGNHEYTDDQVKELKARYREECEMSA